MLRWSIRAYLFLMAGAALVLRPPLALFPQTLPDLLPGFHWANLAISFGYILRWSAFLLLLGPPLLVLLDFYRAVAKNRKPRGFATLEAVTYLAVWVLILVNLFAESFAEIPAAPGTWEVNGIALSHLSAAQSHYLAAQVFLGFSFGDIVPTTTAPPASPALTTSALARQEITLESVVAHFFWAGVTAAFLTLLWNARPQLPRAERSAAPPHFGPSASRAATTEPEPTDPPSAPGEGTRSPIRH
ncbi:MAG: hypothetical protein K6U14_05440 [Firmicutes bacterium]|nr:hypothetical protein [Alicyclobacillaceae bacterium]MCL6497061.1 hypothetical protein [Bacillota bacterium]